ncbi:hypothetical protein SERLADRAFT_477634 [Serpula lacrymans var. lacrymans S7.9]|uniref:Uncharacterized protein n=1 Tax=Serpula lacrymans var. lacrymans (strain S7.9) TaxID=578457 RepID=F8P9B8_SERL9|nr:uncharacterized protein SERLADRAFT_477634 [Serpula lacrymans var. lacrymans S7.9]EGO20247.1 hypothetical protein SERLADRAFT_477634 [Serpula lacrymans var. lacrymans S7.9]
MIRFCCRDLARNTAAVLGLGSALLSDLEVGFDADDDEHLRRHVLFHIEAAFDPAIDEAIRRINMALKELDPNLERCTTEIQSRVRRDLKVQYGSVFSLSPSVLQALHERKLTSLSSRTSFELTQRGLRLELPMLEVREVELLETKNGVHVYKLDVPGLRDVLVETAETLRVLSPMTLMLAILDFKEYAGFNILNELGPKQDNHHQALVLRLLRADMTQYRKVATQGIVHVRSCWGNNFETSIQTVYVK